MYESSSILTIAPETFTTTEGWPREVELILSALESGQHPRSDRRAVRRATYRSQAHLRLFTDKLDAPSWLLYTRDVCGRGLGFITPHYLPLGYGGILSVQMPDGEFGQMQGTLCRCRQVSPGWYEGALNFSREQAEFAQLVT